MRHVLLAVLVLALTGCAHRYHWEHDTKKGRQPLAKDATYCTSVSKGTAYMAQSIFDECMIGEGWHKVFDEPVPQK